MIEVHNLEKRFGAIDALRRVSIRFRKGAVTAVVGPNGSGKTTLIKIILGLVKANTGRIVFDGAQLNGQSAYRERIGYMPQEGQFPENLRVSEVISLLRSLRSSVVKTDERLMTSLSVLGEFRKRVGTLSGGTRQRLNAALAFLFCPDLLILDEPTAGLDPVSCQILKDEILRVRSEGKTVVISSHNLSDIDELADDILFLCDGKPLFCGSRLELTAATGESQLDRAFIVLMEGPRS